MTGILNPRRSVTTVPVHAAPRTPSPPPTATVFTRPAHPPDVPEVTRTDPEGVDFGWVMQTTFVVTIVVGAPLVALLAAGQRLPTWGDRALFAVRVGAVVWILTATAVYAYASRVRSRRRADADTTGDTAGGPTTEGAPTDGPREEDA